MCLHILYPVDIKQKLSRLLHGLQSRFRLDHDPVDVPVYTGHSLINTTNHIVHC